MLITAEQSYGMHTLQYAAFEEQTALGNQRWQPVLYLYTNRIKAWTFRLSLLMPLNCEILQDIHLTHIVSIMNNNAQ